jgi:hypothetical protein
LITGISNLIALPLVAYSFYLNFPGCFLIYLATGIFGEIYYVQSLAVITDPLGIFYCFSFLICIHDTILIVVPPELVTQSVAFFVFIVTLIGGNFPLLIPLFESMVGFNAKVQVEFLAASEYRSGNPMIEEKQFSILNYNANKIQYSLMYVLILSYGLSGLLYIFSYFQLKGNKT